MLAHLIDSTGLCRLTLEYMMDHAYAEYLGVHRPTLSEKLMEMDRSARTDQNIISIKVFPEHMEIILEQRLLERAFHNPHFVFLRREDLLGQAISLARANLTNKWTSLGTRMPAEPAYDEDEITRAIGQLADYNRWWEYFFATRRVAVLGLTYEAVEADPESSIAEIVAFLGFDPDRYPVHLSGVRSARQRDATTEEWRERYLAVHHDMQPRLTERGVPRTPRNAWRFLKGEL